MSIETKVLYNLSARYSRAADAEPDLKKAETLAAKAIEYWRAFQKAAQ